MRSLASTLELLMTIIIVKSQIKTEQNIEQHKHKNKKIIENKKNQIKSDQLNSFSPKREDLDN